MKKTISIFLASLLLIPQVAFAASSDEALEKIILEVKEKIEVPKALTEFSYNKLEDYYSLTWESNDEMHQYLQVRCEEDGDILRYNLALEQQYNKLANINYETGKKNAEIFLKAVVPQYANDLRLEKQMAPNQGEDYCYIYNLYHNGIPVFDQSVRIEVSKQTGQVERFYGLAWSQRNYNEAAPKITLKEAQAIYGKKLEFIPTYQLYYEGKTEKNKSFLAYVIPDQEKGIDAKTGEVTKHYEDYESGRYGYSNASPQDIAKADGGTLTPSEIKAVNEAKNLLSNEAIIQKAQVYFPQLKTASLINNDLYKQQDHYDKQLYFSLSEVEGNIQLAVDAVTGEIKDYYAYYDNAPSQYDKSWGEKAASEFLKAIAPTEFNQTKLTLVEPIVRPIIDPMIEQSKEEAKNETYYFQRKANEIPVSGQGIHITYDKGYGQVTSYHKEWENIEFKAPKGMLPAKEIVKYAGIELNYMEVNEGQYNLVYKTNNEYDYLDAFTGDLINYRGEVAKETSQALYSDIKGHPQETVITKLFNSGIYLQGEKLMPDAAISYEEMTQLLEQAVSKLDEKNTINSITNKKQKLTRQQGVHLIMQYTPYSKIATQGQLYVYPFKDEQIDEKMKGYITLAYGLKIINQKDQYFYPKASLTKAQAMEMIYHLIESNNN